MRILLSALCVALIVIGLDLHRGGLAIAGVAGFWAAMLPRPRAGAVYLAKRPPAITKTVAPPPASHLQEKRS